MTNIIKGKLNLTHPGFARISNNAKDLLMRMLCPDPIKRITPANILAHAWFSSSK